MFIVAFILYVCIVNRLLAGVTFGAMTIPLLSLSVVGVLRIV